jgi:hypothetical protein
MNKSTLTLNEAKKIDAPVVYALCDTDGAIFYIGKTTNAALRFTRYAKAQAFHNSLLTEKLRSGKDFRVKILDYNPENLKEAESKRIKSHDGNLLNIMGRDNFNNPAPSGDNAAYVKAHREREKQAGLRRIEVYVPIEYAKEIRAKAAELRANWKRKRKTVTS